MPKLPVRLLLLLIVLLPVAVGQTTSIAPSFEPVLLPYNPSLDPTSMDKSIDPCVDLYHYACGGWQKKNPIPPDQTSWSVYAKLFQDNLEFLHGTLGQAGSTIGRRDKVTQEIGDFYAACMDEATVEKRGLSAVQPDLDAIAQLSSTKDMAALLARLQLVYGGSIVFAAGSTQDPDNSEQVIAELDQGGLGLLDRDYYTKDDAKSKETPKTMLLTANYSVNFWRRVDMPWLKHATVKRRST